MSEEQPKVKLFREKSMEAVQSPEKLNDYLKVTNAGIWLTLSALVLILIGTVVWGILGNIQTTVNVAVLAKPDGASCVVPYENAQAAWDRGFVTVKGEDYFFNGTVSEPMTVSEETDAATRVYGGLELGDLVLVFGLESAPAEGVYTGTLVTEQIKPISLLLK